MLPAALAMTPIYPFRLAGSQQTDGTAEAAPFGSIGRIAHDPLSSSSLSPARRADERTRHPPTHGPLARIGGMRSAFRLMAQSRSPACQGVDLRAARRRRLGGPALAGVVAGPDLPAIGGARHPARLALVEGQLEHRVRHRCADLAPSPAVPA